jgi:hypothetical protein
MYLSEWYFYFLLFVIVPQRERDDPQESGTYDAPSNNSFG